MFTPNGSMRFSRSYSTRKVYYGTTFVDTAQVLPSAPFPASPMVSSPDALPRISAPSEIEETVETCSTSDPLKSLVAKIG